jgi:hypothetical protein
MSAIAYLEELFQAAELIETNAIAATDRLAAINEPAVKSETQIF